MPITRRALLRTSGLLAGAVVAAESTAAETPATPTAATGPTPDSVPADLFDYARLAPRHMSAIAWNYIEGGAADELSLRWNRESFDRLRLRPRILVDVSNLDIKVNLLGRERPHPILLAPTAYHKLAHPEGEIATAQGAGATDTIFVVSTSATCTLEEVAQAATSPLWFQLYVQRERAFTLELVQRAEAANYEALVVTVDSPVLGPRYRETRSRFTLPPGIDRANLRKLATASGGQRAGEHTIYTALLEPKLTWDDIAWLRANTRLPVLLKGIMTAEDAARAADVGAVAIIVSNHGGRNLDSVPATIDALPEIASRLGGRLPILIDGGIRRGTDVLKAIALGATAVLIGRPYLHGLAVGGAAGVARVVNILRREFEMAMALSGRRSLREIDGSVIWR